MPKYRVINQLISVRKSTDKKSPEYEEFIDYKAGDIVEKWPAHVSVKELLADGHIEEMTRGKN